MAPPERDPVFDDHYGSRRDESPEVSTSTSTAWGQYPTVIPFVY
jgi:hypothetical protein